MILLTSVTDEVLINTDADADLDIQASYIDLVNLVGVPGRKNTKTTAITTETIVQSPASGQQRSVKSIHIKNIDVLANNIVLLHTDGTTEVELISARLEAGETLVFIDHLGWEKYNANGEAIIGFTEFDSTEIKDVFLADRVILPPVIARSASNDTRISVTGPGIYQFDAGSGINSFDTIFSFSTNSATSLGTPGTIPANKWGVILLQGTPFLGVTTLYSILSGANNYSTGYDTEGDALAAIPATGAGQVAVAVITIQASASGFVVGTDALEGGSSGNPATETNYYTCGFDYEEIL